VTTAPSALSWDIAPAAVDSAEAAAVLRAYTTEMADRYYGRPATAAEVDAALAEDPSDDLVPPHGVFLLARSGGRVAGCVGVRRLDAATAEVKRLFVHPGARGAGGGARLLAGAEAAARGLGARAVRLDTRHDLVEARALYAREGYAEIAPYNAGPYAEHWFEKRLTD
jgi:GNAT superfamily N-acetyltransferase